MTAGPVRSLRRQSTRALTVLVGALGLVALSSVVSVVWATTTVARLDEEIAPLQLANRDLLVALHDVTTAPLGISGDTAVAGRPSYDDAVRSVAGQQQRLRDLAEGDARLVRAVRAQDRAVTAMLDLVERTRRGDGPASLGPPSPVDVRLAAVREANDRVEGEIGRISDDVRDRSRTIVMAALALAVAVPLLAGLGVCLLAQQLARSMLLPLTGITQVLGRLRAGDRDARAEVTGPAEVRQIADALNRLTEGDTRAREVEDEVFSRLETLDRVRNDLVSTVSHELRTPLTSIRGYLELLEDQLEDKVDPTQREMLAVVHRNLDRLAGLIDNLLALSRAEETQLHVEPVDLRGVVAQVAADLRLTAASRDVSVRTLRTAEPVVLPGDRSQLTRAVQNLVSNAVKFSRPGGTVELRMTVDSGDAVIEVVDEGIGIPAGDLSGLGQRFFRASNAIKAEIAGTGLGLRIVQAILDRHGGSLAVESVEGEGATFTIRLPLRGGPLAESDGPATPALLAG